jgi:hypothetical protein
VSADYLVIGHFEYLDDIVEAVRAFRARGLNAMKTYAPIPEHWLEEEVYHGRKRSPVRRVTLLGAITGCLGAFLMTSWMSLDYPLRVSAKPLVSFPAFVVIGFECTILIGSIFTLLAMFHFSRIPWLFGDAGFRPEFSEGTFGITIRTRKEETDAIKAELEKFGAKKVEIQYAR